MYKLARNLVVCVALAIPTQIAADISTQFEQLLEDIDQIRHAHGAPSLALTLVSRDRILWSGAFGYADLASRKPATADTLYRIGSITKSFTALAVLLAEEQGLLSVDDQLHKLAPDAPINNPWAKTHPITLEQLLEHTAGLADLTREEFDHSDPTPLTLKQALDLRPKNRTSLWPPGMHASYSNAGAGLAAYALEQVIPMRYENFVAKHLFEPLGMHQANFFLSKAAQSNLATGYDTDGTTIIPYWHMLFRPFGGINAAPREMGAFVQLLLNRGKYKGKQIVRQASIDRMETPQTTLAARSGLRYGYGLGNYLSLYKGFVFQGHGGDGDGYLSHYGYSDELGVGYFVVINAFQHKTLRDIKHRILDYLIGDQTTRVVNASPVDIDQLHRLTGRYYAVTKRFRWESSDKTDLDYMDVIFQHGALQGRSAAGRTQTFLPVSNRHFRYQGESLATIAFVEHQGKLYLQTDSGNYRREK